MHNNKLSFWCRFTVVHKYNKYDMYIYLIFTTIRINYEIEDIDETFTLNINLWMTLRFNFSSLTCIILRVYESVCVLQVQGRGLEYHFKQRLPLFFFFFKDHRTIIKHRIWSINWKFSFSIIMQNHIFGQCVELNYGVRVRLFVSYVADFFSGSSLGRYFVDWK